MTRALPYLAFATATGFILAIVLTAGATP